MDLEKYRNEYYPVEFEFRAARVKRKRLVFGVGINDAPYATQPNGMVCPFYRKWCSMLNRCHSEDYHKKQPTYIGTTHCEEWTYFMNFRAWLLKEIRKTDLELGPAQLDKDILGDGSHYSPENCILVTRQLNLFLNDSLK